MSRQEIPVDVWREDLLKRTTFTGNGVILTMVPEVRLGDTDFRLLPDVVFEACSRFVIGFYGSRNHREVFSLLYKSKLVEHQAADANRKILDAVEAREGIKQSSSLSPEQDLYFQKELKGYGDQLSTFRAKFAILQGIIKDRVTNDPKFESRLRECESAYSSLLLLALQPDNDEQSLELLNAIELVHELIGLNIIEYSLPPIQLS